MRQCPLCGSALQGEGPPAGLATLAAHFAADCPTLEGPRPGPPHGRDRSG